MKRFLLFIIAVLPLSIYAQLTDSEIKKTLFYIDSLKNKNDNYYDEVFLILNQELEKSSGLTQSIWHGILADFLNEYRLNNIYLINRRTPISGEIPEDFKTWDRETFHHQIKQHYEGALRDRNLLKNTPLSLYDSLFIRNNRPGYDQSLTLYDYNICQYIDYYSEYIRHRNLIPLPSYSKLLLPNDQFISFNYASTIVDDELLSLVILHQEYTTFCMKERRELLIRNTLLRYDIVNKISQNLFTDDYLSALSTFERENRKEKEYYNIAFEIARIYKDYYSPLSDYHHGKSGKLDSAIFWFQKVIENTPDSLLLQFAKNEISGITQKEIEFSIKNYSNGGDKPLLGELTSRNCDTVTIIIIDSKTKGFPEKDIPENRKQKEWILHCLQLNYYTQFDLTVPTLQKYISTQTFFSTPSLPVGEYLIIALNKSEISTLKERVENGEIDVEYITVSNIQISYCWDRDHLYFYVTDRSSGKPLKNAQVEVTFFNYWNKEIKKVKIKTEADGKALFSLNEFTQDYIQFSARVIYQNEVLLYKNQYGNKRIGFYRPEDPETDIPEIKFYTNQAIYRPGDTVHYKAIIRYRNDSSYLFKPSTPAIVQFSNPNWEVIAKDSLLTNGFGSVSGHFSIPSTSATGTYRISTPEIMNYTHSIKVEEYKKPQFSITLNPPQTAYKINQSLQIVGEVKAYAGYALDHAKVTYTLSSSYFKKRSDNLSLYYYPPLYSISEQGVISTDKNGNFTLDIFPNDTLYPGIINKIQYTLTVYVTDITGETQSTNLKLSATSESMRIAIAIPDQIPAGRDASFRITALNKNAVPQEAIIHYSIHPIEIPREYYHENDIITTHINLYDSAALERNFPRFDFTGKSYPNLGREGKMIMQGVVNSLSDTAIIRASLGLKEGYYKVKCHSKDQYGDTIVSEKIFHVFDQQASSFHLYQPLWLYSEQSSLQKDEVLEFIVGSYFKNATVRIEIFNNGKEIYTDWINLNQSKERIKMPLTGMRSGEITVFCSLVLDNYNYQETMTTKYNTERRKLKIDIHSFRDEYTPGEKVTVSAEVQDENQKKVHAELLCSMYDASLDALQSNTYILFPTTPMSNFYIYYYYFTSQRSFYFYKNRNYLSYPSDNKKLSLHTLFFSFNPYRTLFLANASWSSDDNFAFDADFESGEGGASLGAQIVHEEATLIQGAIPAQEEAQTTKRATISKPDLSGDPTCESFSFRKDFSESAFFYPHLLTDSAGIATFSFQLPESLTEWHFQCIAHTKDMKAGYLSQRIRTAKPLMLITHPPRFFREGDTINFSTKVVNLRSEDCQIALTLQLLNTENQSVIKLLPEIKTSDTLSLRGDESIDYKFRFVVPKDVPIITYRVMAQRLGTIEEEGLLISYSDGEEKSIPVMPDRLLITESLPLYVNGNQSKSFTFRKMKEHHSKTLENFSFTLEFTSNPIWYALLALPYMMEYPYNCNEQIFSRLYANSIASQIVSHSPEIQSVFESWQADSSQALQSPLQNNPELKNILLQESPWLLQAKNENQQRNNIAKLFDLKTVRSANQTVSSELAENQNSDGGWGWFAGGRSNLFITQHILSGFAKLNQLKIETAFPEKNLKKAIYFTDNEQFINYKQIISSSKFAPKNQYLTHNIIHYLYGRSMFIKTYKLSKEQQSMYDFYLQQAENHWDKQSLYDQGMLAIALYNGGKTAVAQQIIAHLKNRAQYSEEMGMYWKQEGSGWFWYEAPIERQALFIEVFSLINNDVESIEKMQQWLLKQKQQQHWGSTKATVEACHALLSTFQKGLPTDAHTIITIGDEKIDLDQVEHERGTGYFKKSWDSDEVSHQLSEIEIEKHSQGIGWGGAFWQYYEESAKITPAQTSLSIVKSLYKIVIENGREILLPINEKNPLLVGERVRVRMEIRSDRDIEFVHLKDMRAAAFEPEKQLSGYRSQSGLWYYEAPRDVAHNFFFDYLPKGTHVIEYTLIAVQTGNFGTGVTTIQSMYAPEFSAHTHSQRIRVK